jgi:hypothetical protein
LRRHGVKLLQHTLFLLLELSRRFCKRGFNSLMKIGLHGEDPPFNMFEMQAAAASTDAKPIRSHDHTWQSSI